MKKQKTPPAPLTLKDHIEATLLATTQSEYHTSGIAIDVKVTSPEIHLSFERAREMARIPLMLLRLSLEHDLATRPSPKVRVVIRQDATGIRLTYTDSGYSVSAHCINLPEETKRCRCGNPLLRNEQKKHKECKGRDIGHLKEYFQDTNITLIPIESQKFCCRLEYGQAALEALPLPVSPPVLSAS